MYNKVKTFLLWLESKITLFQNTGKEQKKDVTSVELIFWGKIMTDSSGEQAMTNRGAFTASKTDSRTHRLHRRPLPPPPPLPHRANKSLLPSVENPTTNKNLLISFEFLIYLTVLHAVPHIFLTEIVSFCQFYIYILLNYLFIIIVNYYHVTTELWG